MQIFSFEGVGAERAVTPLLIRIVVSIADDTGEVTPGDGAANMDCGDVNSFA
jgi:hypothetical protein